jgi:RimJ/RimL family protein N-acetyltransferase
MSKLLLKTERLTIRDFVEEDWRDIVETRTQEEVARYEPWDTTTWAEREAVVERIREQRALTFDMLDKYVEFAVVLGEKAIGSVGVKRLSDTHKNAEVGWVFDARYWGQGYATEAARALMDWGFRNLELHRIIAVCDARNVPSYRLMERLGMRREAHHVKSFFSKGEWTDDLVYAVLREEWLRRLPPRYTVHLPLSEPQKEPA